MDATTFSTRATKSACLHTFATITGQSEAIETGDTNWSYITNILRPSRDFKLLHWIPLTFTFIHSTDLNLFSPRSDIFSSSCIRLIVALRQTALHLD